jgi:hypothetical protein
MPAITILTGIALIAIGVAFKIGTGTESWTAMIPAIPGVLILLCGAFAFKHKHRALLIHTALVLALLTLIAFAMRVPKSLSNQGTVLAALLLSIAVCAGYIALGVRSFLAARRRRKQQQAGG